MRKQGIEMHLPFQVAGLERNGTPASRCDAATASGSTASTP
jgi:hypothetical protein